MDAGDPPHASGARATSQQDFDVVVGLKIMSDKGEAGTVKSGSKQPSGELSFNVKFEATGEELVLSKDSLRIMLERCNDKVGVPGPHSGEHFIAGFCWGTRPVTRAVRTLRMSIAIPKNHVHTSLEKATLSLAGGDVWDILGHEVLELSITSSVSIQDIQPCRGLDFANWCT